MHIRLLQGLQIHQFTRQSYSFRFASLSSDEIMPGIDIIESFEESFTDAGALLIDGILCRVCDIADATFNVEFYYPITNLFIDSKQFVVIVVKLFECDAFGMLQEKQIHGLGNR